MCLQIGPGLFLLELMLKLAALASGFQHDFLDLEHLALDIDPMSLLRSRLLGSVNFPTEVEEAVFNRKENT